MIDCERSTTVKMLLMKFTTKFHEQPEDKILIFYILKTVQFSCYSLDDKKYIRIITENRGVEML